jgi:2,4-dienoyl-CoA reductase-like NADH-dependent reductase (Old Yellow Enzyme family)
MGREGASARFEYLRLQIRHETREIPALPTQWSEYIVAVPPTKIAGAGDDDARRRTRNKTMSGTLLFSPLTLRGVTLRNRIVVPPMHQYSAVKGFPTDWHLMNAGKFAAGGAGLVVVESTKVERRGCGTLGDLGIWDDKFVEPLSRLVKFIKQQNSVAGIQLGHSGRKARAKRPWEGDGPLLRTSEIDDWDAWTPVAPSAIAHSENGRRLARWSVMR